MSHINYQELRFDHMVEYSQCGTVFAAARQDGYIRLFLIKEFAGDVFARRGRTDSWEPVTGDARDHVLAKARNTEIPRYRINARYQ